VGNSKFKSSLSLKKAVSHLIDKGDIDLALRLTHDYVERIITEPLCTAQIYGSKELDSLCQRIGKNNLSTIRQEITDSVISQQPMFLYIVTRLQKSGGHTRVIEDFIRAQPDAQHIILSTELDGESDVEYLKNMLDQQSNINFEQAPKGRYQKKLTWLQECLLKIQPKKVYLFNHHQDSVAVAAIQPEMKLDASFYHHGDHHLCLGVYLSHLEHIDFHPMGYHNCRDNLGIDNTYIPLTAGDKGDRPADWPFLNDGKLTTCTAAKSNKVEIPYFVSYLELVPKLLQTTGGRHIHIGRLTPWALFKIRRGMKRYNVHPDQFIYTPWVPSVWKALHDYRVDLYVASFPYGGGLTLIEAMGAGVPVALHRHLFSRVLSGIDLAYPEVFSWRFPDELLNYCAAVTPADLEKAGRLGRLQYKKFHTGERLQQTLDELACDRLKPMELSQSFFVDNDEWTFWMERQLTISRVLSRFAYRVFRRFRAWL